MTKNAEQPKTWWGRHLKARIHIDALNQHINADVPRAVARRVRAMIQDIKRFLERNKKHDAE
ncbi:MAG: hypothetical protein KGL39_26970 [Patescibacteria group bacterium]|nr:hypothetical protein [Patescibacteria group bacterium]